MAGQFSKTDQRRITFLSLLSSASTAVSNADVVDANDVYAIATNWLSDMEGDSRFFDQEAQIMSRPTSPSSSGPRPASPRPASPSRPPTRGRDGGNKTPYSGQPLRDPDGPPTDAQVATALKLTDEYSEDDLYSFTKQQVSDLISDLKG